MLPRAYLLAGIVLILLVIFVGWWWLRPVPTPPMSTSAPLAVFNPLPLAAECTGDPLSLVNANPFLCEVAARYREFPLPSFFVLPWHPHYDRFRQNHNKRDQYFPEVLAQCHEEAEVLTALKFAREHQLPWSVRGGGYGASLGSGMVIDVGAMEQMVLDKDQHTVYCGPGVKAGPLLAYLGEHGLAAAVGTTPGLSVAGLVRSGGYGHLTRKYGRTVDTMVNARVVLPSGEVVMVTSNPPEGVIVGLTLRVFPITEVYLYRLTYPEEEVALALEKWYQLAPELPEGYSSEVLLTAQGMVVQGLIFPVAEGYKQLKRLLTKNCNVEVDAVSWLEAVRALIPLPTPTYYEMRTALLTAPPTGELRGPGLRTRLLALKGTPRYRLEVCAGWNHGPEAEEARASLARASVQ